MISQNDLLFMIQQYYLVKDSSVVGPEFMEKCTALIKSIDINHVVINHFWTVETVLMSSNENIQFDFTSYALSRKKLYDMFTTTYKDKYCWSNFEFILF